MVDVVTVLTFKSTQHMIDDGGSQAWAASEDRLRNCTFVVCARNKYGPHRPEGPEEHRHAFLVGRISDIERTDGGRFKIMFDEYALVDGPELPFNGANPVQYYGDRSARGIVNLGIDFDNLVWHAVKPKTAIDRAKDMLSAAYKVPVESNRIQIEV